MGTNVETINLLEKRISTLENFVRGPKDVGGNNTDIIGSLVKSNAGLNKVICGSQKILNLFKQLDDLEHYLSLELSKKAMLSNRTKVDIIAAEEELITQSAENLEKVNSLSKALDSEHIKSVSSLNGKLNQLCTVHLQQKEAANAYSSELKSLLEHYNNVVLLLSKQLSHSNSIIMKMEREKGSSTES